MKTALQRKLAAADIDAAEIARVIGKCCACVYNKLNGKSEWTVGEMWQIARYIGLDEQEMLMCFPAR